MAQVFDAAADGADLVHGPTERHGAVAADAAVGGTQAGSAANAAGRDDGAQRFRAQREAHEPRGSSRRRAGRGTAGAGVVVALLLVPAPRTLGPALKPEVALRQRAHGEFGHQHRARVAQPLDAGGVVFGHALHVRLGAPGGQNALGIEKILDSKRNTVQRPAILAGPDFPIGFGGVFERDVFGEGDEAEQLGRILLHAREVHLGQVCGRDRARAQQRSKPGDRPVGGVFQVRRRLDGRHRGDGGGKALRTFDGLAIGQAGVEGERGLGVVRDIDLAQGFVVTQRPVDAGEHHVHFAVLKIEAKQHEGAFQLIFGDTHGLLSASSASGGRLRLRIGRTRGGQHGHQLNPGSSVHKSHHDT